MLTGDGDLRRVAEKNQIDVHGVLWITDELEDVGACSVVSLIKVLEVWRDDGSVFLPSDAIEQRLRYLRRRR